VSNLQEYFHTDWAAMTLHDWIGLIVTVGIFCLMVFAYVYVFHPKNKAKFESQRLEPIDADTEKANDRQI
jgi:cytochrome c oxidase cbb3-type subunit 4